MVFTPIQDTGRRSLDYTQLPLHRWYELYQATKRILNTLMFYMKSLPLSSDRTREALPSHRVASSSTLLPIPRLSVRPPKVQCKVIGDEPRGIGSRTYAIDLARSSTSECGFDIYVYSGPCQCGRKETVARPMKRPDGSLGTLYVNPAYRGKGLGGLCGNA